VVIQTSKYLVDNNCHIWDGDAYKNFEKHCIAGTGKKMSKEEFINFIKTNDEFAKKWGELGPIYGKQWRRWSYQTNEWYDGKNHYDEESKTIDQIENSINLLKTDPDSRRIKVSAWNVGEMDQMTLPPCHTDFNFIQES
jgi:thymidylate synthase